MIIQNKFSYIFKRASIFSPIWITSCRTFATGKWNVLFFGTDEFAVEHLSAINLARNSGIIGKLDVVSVSPKSITPAVHTYCKQEGLQLHQWPIEVMNNTYDLGVVVSFGYLIPSEIIDMFPLGILNVHGSLLPKWRGAAPIIHSILNGDEVTGITIMKIEPFRFDVGKIIDQVTVPISWNAKSGALSATLAHVGAQALLNVLLDLTSYLQKSTPQPNHAVTKAPKVSKAKARIYWSSHTCRSVQNYYRALDDIYPLWTVWESVEVRLREMILVPYEYLCNQNEAFNQFTDQSKDLKETNIFNCPKVPVGFPDNIQNTCDDTNIMKQDSHRGIRLSSASNSIYTDIKPGSVFFDKQKNVLNVKCLDGFVSFTKVCVKGRKGMSAKDFYNGFLNKVAKDRHIFC